MEPSGIYLNGTSWTWLKNRPAPSKHVYLRTTNLVQLCHFPDEATETQGPRNQPLSETKCIKNRRLSPEYGNQPHTSLAVSTTLTFDPNSNDCLSYLFNASGIWGLGPSSILKFIIERQTHTHTIHTHTHMNQDGKKDTNMELRKWCMVCLIRLVLWSRLF